MVKKICDLVLMGIIMMASCILGVPMDMTRYENQMGEDDGQGKA